jgi:hypothetical protein
MSTSTKGGLVLDAAHPGVSPVPLVDGDDVSWMPRILAGDNQGNYGACALFSMASWAETMTGKAISDFDVLAVYQETLERCHLPANSGLLFQQAFDAAVFAMWIPGNKGLVAVRDLRSLVDGPILAGYAVTDAWNRVSTQGCLDHDPALTAVDGYHAVLIIGKGVLSAVDGGPWVWVENSWGWQFGWNGIAVMSDRLHRDLCREMWAIV